MNNISSFLEADSFFSPPPLKKVDSRFPLGLLCTMGLEETQGDIYEFGIESFQNIESIECFSFLTSPHCTVWLPQYWLCGRTEVRENERSRVSEPLQESKETEVYSLSQTDDWKIAC